MDAKGDHGGESADEVEAALWMYSKKPIFGRSSPLYTEPPTTAKDRPVAQIDLVPTLALLLGIPIPFNNLGAPIEEAFIGKRGSDYENLARVNALAAAQIQRYMAEYALVRRLDDAATGPPLALWSEATKIRANIVGNRRPSANDWKTVSSAFEKYQKETLAICRSLWARFNIVNMIHGIEALAAALVTLIVYARGIKGDRTELTPILLKRGWLGTVLGALSGFAGGALLPSLPLVHSTVYCAAVGSAIGITSAFWYLRRRLQSPLPNSLWAWVGVVLALLLSIGFAANSFTIWEDEILLFFVGTFGVLTFVSSLRQEKSDDRVAGCYHSILFVGLTRLASLSRLCREEQMPYCKSTYYASATSSTSAAWQLVIPFLLAFVLPGIVKQHYHNTRSYQGSAVLWLGFAFRIGLCLSAVFWTLDTADDAEWFPSWDKTVLKTGKVMVAQLVLAIAFAAGYSTYAWAPPFVSMQRRAKTQSANGTTKSDQPVVSEDSSSVITILGYSNVHGSRYFLLVTMWALAIILVQKPMGGGAIGIFLWQILSLLEIISANKLSSTAVGPVVLALLGSYHYFKTGHQAALSSIQWESAFIALKALRYPWSPLLVVLNTLGAQMLAAVAVPATVLWKQPAKKKGLLGDVAQAMATHILFYATVQLATTMWAGHLRRHLMLYRIFSPRFMLGTVTLLIVDVVAVFVAVGGTRWSFLSVADVFGWT